ncbi:hypothetical protein COU54_02055 [Candidatus Pacearchaeota archaeon CG10_big_fil_rev_8_21_14_0_10_31_24]|nr:MAG: hypothetical protein COU54_02055 [Candidatus Pacearchaeota archaeon CG10_big_fil_rev_8_21_14_0_10_31_24]
MYDIERIGKIVSDIERYLKEIEGYNINFTKDLEDSKNYHASSMIVFAIFNRIIDLGGEIISAERLGAPNAYQDIMPLLAKAGLMNKSEAEDLNKLVIKRNILAHFYEDIDEKELFSILKELVLVKKFVEKIKKRISKNREI